MSTASISRRILLMPLVALMTTSLLGAEPDLKGEVAKLFEVGWEPSLRARSACSDQFAKLDRMAPVDRRIPYAYALVHIRQRSYPYAAKLVGDVLAKEPDNLHAWRVKIWLSMLLKQYSAAMAEADNVAQVIGDDGTESPGDVRTSRMEMAAFLGRIFGFLSGPAFEDVSAASVETSQKKVLSRLTETQRAGFDMGRRMVVDRFANMTGEQSRVREQAAVDAENRAAQIKADLAAQADRIAQELKEIGPKQEKAEDELKSELSSIDGREQPLLSQLARLETQAVIIRREALPIAADIETLERLAARERDPIERARLLREADRLAIIYRRYDAQLVALEREAAVINAQRAQLMAQRQQLQAQHQREMGQLQKTAEELGRGQKRIALEERKLAKPETGNTPRVREMARVAEAFTTYEQLPLDSERQRILDSFR